MSTLDHLYVIDLGRTVKVGRSTEPDRRLAHHASIAAAHGIAVGEQWISAPMPCAVMAERELIARCSAIAPPVRHEYFPIPFEVARSEAEAVKYEPRPSSPDHLPVGDWAEVMKAYILGDQRPASEVAEILGDLRDSVLAGDVRAAAATYEYLTSLRTDWRTAALMAIFASCGIDALVATSPGVAS